MTGVLDRLAELARQPMATQGSLAALALTLGAYAAAQALWRRGRRHPLLNPTLLAIILVGAALLGTGADYRRYFAGAWPIHLLLGPAVVALAVPLWRHLPALQARSWPLLVALLAGSLVAIASAPLVAALLGASDPVLASLAPKSATVAVSMGIAAKTGGVPAVTAVVTILAGITGAVVAGPLLDLARISDPIARGFGMGLASHGIATARAFEESEAAGTAAGLAMGLNAVLTAILVPVVLGLLR